MNISLLKCIYQHVRDNVTDQEWNFEQSSIGDSGCGCAWAHANHAGIVNFRWSQEEAQQEVSCTEEEYKTLFGSGDYYEYDEYGNDGVDKYAGLTADCTRQEWLAHCRSIIDSY